MRLRLAIGVAVALALVLVCATVHELREGAQSLAASDAALAQGDKVTAIARARAAAEAVAPASPYPARAYDRLAAIARDAEAHGDEATAMAAWTATRAAALETRAFGVDTDARRTAADEGIARVGGAAWRGTDPSGGTEVRVSEAALREALARDDSPATWRFALLAAAAASFFAGAGRLAWIGGDAAVAAQERGRTRGQLAVAASAAGLGLVLYVLACLRG